MSWSVTVKPPVGFPDVKEKIASFSQCPGNMYMCVLENTGTQLKNLSWSEAMIALGSLIFELDKGNDGIFNDQWAVESDKKWSGGSETKESWSEWEKLTQRNTSYEVYCGETIRNRCREDAVRFYLYYSVGYEIRFEW